MYERYINERHADGDMYPATLDHFEKFLVHSCTESFFIELWDDQKLIAVSTCDLMDELTALNMRTLYKLENLR